MAMSVEGIAQGIDWSCAGEINWPGGIILAGGNAIFRTCQSTLPRSGVAPGKRRFTTQIDPNAHSRFQ
jgi:hypothetical protein